MHTTLISTAKLAGHLDDPGWAVVDCRFSLQDTEAGRRAYREAHIPGAVYAHLDEDLSGQIAPGRTSRHPLPDVDAFAARLAAWGIGDDTQVAAYDAGNGAVASRLWWMLRWLGHEAVAVLDGGWAAWQAEGRPVHGGVEHRQPAAFTPRPRPELALDADKVLAYVASGGALIVDARAPERYRGENEPLDPVAGHIPGAVNHFYAENLAGDRFLPPNELRARLEPLIGRRRPGEVVFYCGSGVTACHNALAMLHAGLGEARIYPGSWSEWITDPDRPIASD